MSQNIDSFISSNTIIKLFIYFTPILIVINIPLIHVLRFLCSVFIFGVLLINYKFPIKNGIILFLILYLFSSVLLLFRKSGYSFFANIFIIIDFYWIFNSPEISLKINLKQLRYVYLSLIIVLLFLILYMYSIGTYIRGGEYMENALHISNLTAPFLLGVVSIFSFYYMCRCKHFSQKVSYFFVIFISVAFMFILGKRLPIFSLIASILLIMVIKGNKPILTIILFVLLLYPFYSFLLFESATAYFQSDLFTMFFQRNEDLIDIENNPRLARIIAATEFFNKFELINIFYYPKEIILSSSEAHNHFHNLILQLYYEKGLISIIAIIVMSIKLLWIAPRKAMIINGIMLPLLFYFFMIGTSESLFLHRSSTESFIMIFIVIGYGIARKINSLKLHS